MKKSILFFSLLMLSTYCFAQGDPGGNPDAPFDGGVTLLAAAAAAYGVKKLKKSV